MQYEKKLQKLDDGTNRWMLSYKTDAGETRLIGDSPEDVALRAAESHVHATSALTRAKANFQRIQAQAQPTKDAEILAAREMRRIAENQGNVYKWAMRNPQFWPVEANNSIIDGYIKANGLSYSLEDIEHAYLMVCSQLCPKPSQREVPAAAPAPTPAQTHAASPSADLPTRAELAAMSGPEFQYMCRHHGKDVIEGIIRNGGNR